MGPHPASDQHPTEVTSFLESTRRAGGWWVPGSRAAVADQSLRARAPTLPGCASLDQLGCSRRARAGSRVLPVSHLNALLWGCSLEPGSPPSLPPPSVASISPGEPVGPCFPLNRSPGQTSSGGTQVEACGRAAGGAEAAGGAGPGEFQGKEHGSDF